MIQYDYISFDSLNTSLLKDEYGNQGLILALFILYTLLDNIGLNMYKKILEFKLFWEHPDSASNVFL